MNSLAGRQIKLSFERSPLDLAAHAIAALLVAGVGLGQIPAVSLMAWLLGIAGIAGLRLLMARAFLLPADFRNPSAWSGADAVVNLVRGLIWGLLAFMQPDLSSLTQTAVILLTATVCAISLWSTASSAMSFPAMMLGLLIPWCSTLLMAPSPPSATALACAGIGVIFIGLFVLVNRQANELLRAQMESVMPALSLRNRETAKAKLTAVTSDTWMSAPATAMTTLAEREARPYSGVKRRVSDFRAADGPLNIGKPASRFGQIKINNISTREPDLIDPADCTVLVVEDNLDNQLVALHLLQKRGYRVVIANNGREALSAVERQRFDLILMDLQMPEMGGLETTAAIRLKEKTGVKRIPIVALTANPVSESREICLAAGMDDYLSKPISRSRLFAIIDAQLRKKRPS